MFIHNISARLIEELPPHVIFYSILLTHRQFPLDCQHATISAPRLSDSSSACPIMNLTFTVPRFSPFAAFKRRCHLLYQPSLQCKGTTLTTRGGRRLTKWLSLHSVVSQASNFTAGIIIKCFKENTITPCYSMYGRPSLIKKLTVNQLNLIHRQILFLNELRVMRNSEMVNVQIIKLLLLLLLFFVEDIWTDNSKKKPSTL